MRLAATLTRFYQSYPTTDDLHALARLEVADGEGVVKQVYGWREGRASTLAQAFLVQAVGLLAAVVLALFKDDFDPEAWQIAVLTGGSLVLVVAAVLSRWWVGRIHREYLAAVELYTLFKP